MAAKPSKQVLGGQEKVKVAIAQKSPAFMNREASAQLVVFPEAWLAGYPYWTEGWDSPVPQWVGGRLLFRDNALVVPSEDSERIAHAVRRAGGIRRARLQRNGPQARSPDDLQQPDILRARR